jgi:HSP20 family protein
MDGRSERPSRVDDRLGIGNVGKETPMLPSLLRRNDTLFPLIRFRDSMDRFFDEFMGSDGLFAWPKETNGKVHLPAIDLKETDAALILETELPGLEAKDVTIKIEGDLLSIHGERKDEKEEKTKTVYRKECSFGEFDRQVRLPMEIDADKADAEYKNGVLKLTMPKKPGQKSKTVAVKVK